MRPQDVSLKWLLNYSTTGTTPNEFCEESVGTPWYTPDAFKEQSIHLGAPKKFVATDTDGVRLFPAGSVLVVGIGTIGKLASVASPCSGNQQINCMTPGPQLSPRYLAYALTTKTEEMYSMAGSSTLPILNQERMRSLRIPCLELEQQERIANILEEKTARIDTLISEKEALIFKLFEHQYSYNSLLMTHGPSVSRALQETNFPELGEIPSHWAVKRLKFLGEVRSGIAKGKDHGEKDTVSLPYLRVANVQDGYVDLTEVLEIEVGAQEVERFLLKKGDVLMNEGGDNDKLGRGTVWEGQIEPCVHQNHVFAVRMFDIGLAEWVARFTSTDAARTYFFLRSKQSTNLASINQSNVRELPVPMPPTEEREAILAEIRRSAKATSDLVEHVKEHIERLKEYRASLISAAVTGQLKVSQFKVAA